MHKSRILLISVLFFTFISAGSSKNLHTYTNKPFPLEKMLPQGYVKDGSVDYTDEIQTCLDQHRYVIFPDFPVMVNDTGLKLYSNSKLEFPPKSLVILKPSYKESYNIFEMMRVENIELINPKVRGDKETHLGKDGADGHGISIRASKNIVLINPIVEQCWGDGILIGGLVKPRHNSEGRYVPSENIRISGGLLVHNRRNGLSIMSIKNILVENLEIASTKGAFPMAGIDLEPNYNKDYMENVVLRNIVTRNNRYGIQIVMKKLVGAKDANVDILIDNHVDYKSQFGVRFDKMDRKGKKLTGEVKIVNSRWENNKHHGIFFEPTQDNFCGVQLVGVHAIKNGKDFPIRVKQTKSRIKIL